MTVGELIEALAGVDVTRIVVLSVDEEGNDFNELREIDITSNFTADEEVGPEALTPELVEQGYGAEDIVGGRPCVVLWP